MPRALRVSSNDLISDLRLQSDRRLAMAACALIAIPAGWFLSNDLDAPGGAWFLNVRILARVILVTAAIAGFVLLLRASNRVHYSRIVFGVAMTSSLAYLALYLPRIDGLPWRIRPVALAVMYFAMPNSLKRQILPPLVLSSGLAYSLIVHAHPPGSDVTGDLLALVVINIAGLLVVVRRNQLEQDVSSAWSQLREAHHQAETASTELKALKGIIPICSHCKNVRTERGGWQAIEEYVREQSSADFSHGICPTCLEQVYAKHAINA